MANTVRRRWGDRKDGRLLRTLAPFYRQIPFIMKATHDCQNAFDEKFEITAAEKLIRSLRLQGYKNMSLLHVFMAAYQRTVAEFPALNRFVAGQRIFARHKLEIAVVVKKKMSTQSGETAMTVELTPEDSLISIYEKVNVEIDKIKNETKPNHTEATANALMKIPRLPLKFVMWFMTVLDYFGKLPMSIINADPFHRSLIISDLGSVGIGKIYHHLYDFGTLPVLLAFGKKYGVYELDREGVPAMRRYVDYGVVVDERICDGFYYATAFKHLNHYLHNPEVLREPPEIVNKDID
ncbi:MAG: hypothetical protein LBC65_05060 [Oscillospiraceae bacterium]|nr:hypothetical protein [Oscillospiraceae bacterium]